MNDDQKPTIDERLEAIVQTLELMAHDSRETGERLDRLAERQGALAESIELLRGSVSDLTAIVHAQTTNLAEVRARDRQYFLALADLLRSWGAEE